MNAPLPSDLFPKRRDNGVVSDAATRDPERAPEFISSQPESEAGESRLAKSTDYQLGNPELPIADFRERIVDAVLASQATIITAETGAGKSTQVPQFLAEAGYEVIVTQPRVVAARTLAERVGEEVVAVKGKDFEKFVGYRTSRERGDHESNEILFVTDGLQQVRELAGRGVGKHQVLILDEVHEWNENMEVLIAWAKKHMREDPNFKVAVMSATMESQKLADFFADNATREVPVIEVPGRTFDVKKDEGGDVAEEAVRLASAGKNTLVFVPGKAEIEDVMQSIARANIPGATILPLHGQQEPSEQRKVFAKYPGVKVIVATNVAQTSITIDDIDAVVDSGLERQNQVKDGVEGLYLNPISQADCLQRAGRAGRTKEGEYVLAQLGNNRLVTMAERHEYGTPEIMRTRLDGMVLRLAKNGFDASEFEFYHQPDHADIIAAKERLQKLGALTEDGVVTKIGRDMERMPVESHYARMMIEARKYSPDVQAQLAAILAIEEAGGILQHAKGMMAGTERWRAFLGQHQDSDMLKQLEVYIKAQSLSNDQKRESNIFVKAFHKTRDIEKQLRGVEWLNGEELRAPTDEEREQLVKCIVAGMVDNLYVKEAEYSQYYRDARGGARERGNRALIRPGAMIVGVPFDLEIETRRGKRTLHLIESSTNVPSVDTLREVAPQLFSERLATLTTDIEGNIMEKWQQFFNGQDTGSSELRPSQPSAERTRYITDKLASDEPRVGAYRELNDAVAILQQRTSDRLLRITPDDVRGMLEVALPLSVGSYEEARAYLPIVELEDLVSAEQQAKIAEESPDNYMGMDITYMNGQPQVKNIDTEVLASMPPQACALPDGRHIYGTLRNSGYYAYSQPLDQLRNQAIKIIERQREQEAAEQAANTQRLIGMMTSATVNGNPMSQSEMDLYEITPEMVAQAQVQADEIIAAREAAQKEQEELRHAAKLRNEDLYDLIRCEDDLDDLPDELHGRVLNIHSRLDELYKNTWSAPADIQRYLDKIEQDITPLLADLTSWRDQFVNTKEVPDDMLARLKAKFNG